MLLVKAETTKKFVSAIKSMPVQCIEGVLGFVEELLDTLCVADKSNEKLLKLIQDIKRTAEKEIEDYENQGNTDGV